MPRQIQTMGYPSRAAAAFAMRQSGQTVHEIAAQMGCEPKVIAKALREYSPVRRISHAVSSASISMANLTYAPRRPSSLMDEIMEARQRAHERRLQRMAGQAAHQ